MISIRHKKIFLKICIGIFYAIVNLVATELHAAPAANTNSGLGEAVTPPYIAEEIRIPTDPMGVFSTTVALNNRGTILTNRFIWKSGTVTYLNPRPHLPASIENNDGGGYFTARINDSGIGAIECNPDYSTFQSVCEVSSTGDVRLLPKPSPQAENSKYIFQTGLDCYLGEVLDSGEIVGTCGYGILDPNRGTNIYRGNSPVKWRGGAIRFITPPPNATPVVEGIKPNRAGTGILLNFDNASSRESQLLRYDGNSQKYEPIFSMPTSLVQGLGLNDRGEAIFRVDSPRTVNDPLGNHTFYWNGNSSPLEITGRDEDDKGGLVHFFNNSGTVYIETANGRYLWTPSGGAQPLQLQISNAEIIPNIRSMQILAMNDNGDMVGYLPAGDISKASQARMYLLRRSTPVVMLDPIGTSPYDEDSLYDDRTSTILQPTDPTKLARLAEKGRIVDGAVADGVTQLLVRINSTQPGETYSISFPDAMCTSGTKSVCSASYGKLFSLGSSLQDIIKNDIRGDSIQVSSVASPRGPIALFGYRSPSDFNRLDGYPTENIDAPAKERTIAISVKNINTGKTQNIAVKIIRPAIVLVHGNWSDAGGWDSYTPLCKGSKALAPYCTTNDTRFSVYRTDYSASMLNGILQSVPDFTFDLRRFSLAHKINNRVAGIQMDVIGYSMGGLVARAARLSYAYTRSFPYEQGAIHKLITLNTPHLGSPFAEALATDSPTCKNVFQSASDNLIRLNIEDLRPNSNFLHSINAPSIRGGIMAATAGSLASSSQIDAAETTAAYWVAKNIGGCKFAPQNGFNSFFGQGHDLVVPMDSQNAKGLAYSVGDTIPFIKISDAAIHTFNKGVYPIGPDVLGHGIESNELINALTMPIITLLNTPATGGSGGILAESPFRRIRP